MCKVKLFDSFEGPGSATNFLLGLISIFALLCSSLYHKRLQAGKFISQTLLIVSWFLFSFCQRDELAGNQTARWRQKVVCFWFLQWLQGKDCRLRGAPGTQVIPTVTAGLSWPTAMAVPSAVQVSDSNPAALATEAAVSSCRLVAMELWKFYGFICFSSNSFFLCAHPALPTPLKPAFFMSTSSAWNI